MTHLHRALSSVLEQQPRPPAQVLVIDGNSTDGSDALVEAWALRWPQLSILRQRGVGLAGARNEGMAMASQPWLAFCDADDAWSPGALKLRLDALGSPPLPSAVVGQVVLEALPGVEPTRLQEERLGQARPGFTPGALLVHTDLVERLGSFDEGLSIGSDSDWLARLHDLAGPILCLEAITLIKGARTGSLSTQVDTYRRDLLQVARRHIQRRRNAG
ncbi:glycosyltransferase [Synechococcus sp. ATX 2A4]|nr:glycosyltransferase [Synechococcus sp. ATX 2A4]